MMTIQQARQRVLDVMGPAEDEREMLVNALKLVAAYDHELHAADKTAASLRAQLLAAKRKVDGDGKKAANAY